MFLSFTWALILIISSKANRARFFLGLFMSAVSVIFLSHVVYYHHLKQIYLPFDLLFIFGSLSIFPIYYWYMKILTFRSEIDFNDMKLLLPAFVLVVATSITYLFMSSGQETLYINEYLYGNGNWQSASPLIKTQLILGFTLQVVYFVQIMFSFAKIRVFIADYNDNIANFYSNLEDKTMQWPKIILYSFVITSVFTIFTNFLGRSFFDKYPVLLLFTGLGYSVFLFVLGYLGYMQNHSIESFEQDNNTGDVPENLSTKKIKLKLRKLFVEEKIYTHKDLKLSEVAASLNTNRTYISTLINTEYDCSFSTFVNQYRVEEAKELLLCKENSNFSLDHIATLSGFGSLHSFIRVFKEITGTTPGRFRETAKNSQSDLSA